MIAYRLFRRRDTTYDGPLCGINKETAKDYLINYLCQNNQSRNLYQLKKNCRIK